MLGKLYLKKVQFFFHECLSLLGCSEFRDAHHGRRVGDEMLGIQGRCHINCYQWNTRMYFSKKGLLVYGPYSSKALFSNVQYQKYLNHARFVAVFFSEIGVWGHAVRLCFHLPIVDSCLFSRIPPLRSGKIWREPRPIQACINVGLDNPNLK